MAITPLVSEPSTASGSHHGRGRETRAQRGQFGSGPNPGQNAEVSPPQVLGRLDRSSPESQAEQGAQRHRSGVVTASRSRSQSGEHVAGTDQAEERVQQHRPGITAPDLRLADPGHQRRLGRRRIAITHVPAGVVSDSFGVLQRPPRCPPTRPIVGEVVAGVLTNRTPRTSPTIERRARDSPEMTRIRAGNAWCRG